MPSMLCSETGAHRHGCWNCTWRCGSGVLRRPRKTSGPRPGLKRRAGMARRGQNEGCRYNSDKFRNDCFPCFPLLTSFMTLATSTPPHDRSMAADWRLCVAPMVVVTDRPCRLFHRLLEPRARLYTEMITTGRSEEHTS